MLIKKFIGATTRDALKALRADLGDDAIILSTKQSSQGVEVLASKADADNFVRDATREHTELRVNANVAAQQASVISPKLPTPKTIARPSLSNDLNLADEEAWRPSSTDTTTPIWQDGLRGESQLLAEILAIKKLVHEQLGALSWRETVERHPMRSELWHALIQAGYSPLFARTVVEKLPETIQGEAAYEWTNKVLCSNLGLASFRGVQVSLDMVMAGGRYALVGPTGVGKTTTIAKIAARCVVKHGADALGLITTDHYRIGAPDQLRIYGKLLGVPVYQAQSKEDLYAMMANMARKHLVLVDSVGMGQRDPRVDEQARLFDESGVARVLLLNAATQVDTLDDVAKHYRGSSHLSAAILTKLDEAIKLGCGLDVLIRHRLPLAYLATGQRVPEDLFLPDKQVLVQRSMSQGATRLGRLSQQEMSWSLRAGAMPSRVNAETMARQ